MMYISDESEASPELKRVNLLNQDRPPNTFPIVTREILSLRRGPVQRLDEGLIVLGLEVTRCVFKLSKNGMAQELTKKEYTPYFEKFFERNWSVGTSTEVVKPIEGPRALQIVITSFPIAAKKYGLEYYKFEYLKDGVRFSSGCYIPMVEVT